jgi:chemotaxis protein methyltransferase CheR
MTESQAIETIVDRVAELLCQHIGLRAEPTLRGRLRRAVRDEVTVHGLDLSTYVNALVPGGDALEGLLDRVTVQETAFFRHPQHFAALARDVLPTLPRPVTIWSAGCANGQEAFSLAMLLEEQQIDGHVIATDLSTAALHRTMAARYTSRELSGLSPQRVAAHLTRTGEDTWQVNQSVRDRVRTLRHNLLDPLPSEVLACQVVFCRNVIIYLTPQHASAFFDRIADMLTSADFLFLGAAETIWQFSDRFKAIAVGDTYIYRRPVTGTAVDGTPAELTRSPADGGRTRFQSTVRPRPAAVAVAVEKTPSRPAADSEPAPAAPTSTETAALAKGAQDAMAAGDYDTAVVAFRKCAYLAPLDPMAQLHLGLALQGAGDERSAQRAYAAARRALIGADPAHSIAGIDGIATAELVRLLDTKQRGLAQ